MYWGEVCGFRVGHLIQDGVCQVVEAVAVAVVLGQILLVAVIASVVVAMVLPLTLVLLEALDLLFREYGLPPPLIEIVPFPLHPVALAQPVLVTAIGMDAVLYIVLKSLQCPLVLHVKILPTLRTQPVLMKYNAILHRSVCCPAVH